MSVTTKLTEILQPYLGTAEIDVTAVLREAMEEAWKDEELRDHYARQGLQHALVTRLRAFQARDVLHCQQMTLFPDEIHAYYAVDNNRWRRTDTLNQAAFTKVLANHQIQQEALTGHVDALLELYEQCLPQWRTNPRFTVAQCLV